MSDEQEPGFEFGGRFYRWHFSDIGKDLILVDRIANVPIDEFVAQVDDAWDSGRAPIQLALIATSLRHGNPDWPLERVVRTVMELSLSGDVKPVMPTAKEEETPVPPVEAAPVAANGSASSSESKPTSSEPEPEPSEIFNATPV